MAKNAAEARARARAIARAGAKVGARASRGDESVFRRIKLKASYCFGRLASVAETLWIEQNRDVVYEV